MDDEGKDLLRDSDGNLILDQQWLNVDALGH
jgi:hypothetical protein